MSRTIDERVVEMRFDNRQFQAATAATMSTLDKLKASLRFDGASKGLENISAATKKIDMNGLGGAIDSVKMKFSSLEVIGVTALANITNSVVNSGKRMISALTIDPIKTGFQEYETQLNSVQTILANTQSKGSTLEEVNAALNELNKYADQTIYNFTEMTRNIGTFTAAGVDLETSVTSIKGIANLAAISGSNAQQASTAMYQLSQALAAGRVSLMDWNSVVNAGMGGEVFQTALKRTAKQMGYNVDALIEKYGSFRESLTQGQWLTTEVLTETLTQISGAYTEADLIAQGYSKEQAKQITELAQTAVDAATKVKTVTQLWDTMKEAVQSGWSQTWQLLFGDFEEARVLFTDLSNFFGNFIEKSANARNELLKGALGPQASWQDLTKEINEAGVATEDFESKIVDVAKSQGIEIDKIIEKEGSLSAAFQNGALSSKLIVDTLKSFGESSKTVSKSTEDMSDKLKYFQEVVDSVWYGSYKNGEERIKALTDAGYDYAKVQDLVNKTVDGHRLTLEDLSEAQLVSLGYTEEEISKINELAKEAEKSGTSLNTLIENLSKPSGRQLLIESFWNILNGITDTLGAIKTAWRDAFPPMTSDALYKTIESVRDFTAAIKPSEETLDKLTRTFKGLFAVLDIVSTITNGALKVGFKVLGKVLGSANLDILTLTANLGDALVALRDFVLSNEFVDFALDNIATGILAAANAIKGWVNAFLEIPKVQEAINELKAKLKEFPSIAKDAIQGFKNGLEDGAASIPDILVNLGKAILKAIKDVLGIHSPSREMEEVGNNVIQGLINGIESGINTVITIVKSIASKIVEIFNAVPWGSILAAGIGLSLLYFAKKILDVTDVFVSFGDVLEGVANVLNSFAFSIKLNAIKGLAIGLAILAGSIFLLAQLDTAKLWGAIGAMGALAAIIGVLAVAMGKWGPKEAVKFGGFAFSANAISVSILILAVAIARLQSLDPDKAAVAIVGFAAIVASLIGILKLSGQLVEGPGAKNAGKIGAMMLKLSVSMLLMVAVIKLISGLKASEVIKGGAAITGFVALIMVLAKINKTFGESDIESFGKMLTRFSTAMLLLVVVLKILGSMDVGDIVKGELAITGFVGIIYLLAKINKTFGVQDTTKLASTIAGVSAAMLVMAVVVKIMGSMSVGDIIKGEAALLGFVGIMTLMVNMLKISDETKMAKVGATLLAMSASLAIMSVTAILLGMISIPGLMKGVTAISILGVVMATMIKATKGANDVRGNLIAMTVAIGIMATAVAALSFIDPSRLAGATAALSILMGMFALIAKSAKNIKGSMGTLIVMSAAVALLAGILVVLSKMPIEQSLAASASLSLLMVSMSIMMTSLKGIGKIAPTAYLALGVLIRTIGGLATILGTLASMNVGPTLEIAKSLSLLLLSLSAACGILAVVGTVGAASALAGALALDGVIVIIGGLMVGIGALTKHFPQMEEFLNTGIVLLEKIGYGIGSFFGNIIGGFMSGATAGLPEIAKKLSEFIENLQPFLQGATNIDPSVVNSTKSLAEMILILTAADLLNGIVSFLGGGESSLSKFAEELVPFGLGMVSFSQTVSGKIDESAVTAAANAGRTLAELAATIPKQGGFLQNFLGGQDLSTFGNQLVSFGGAIVAFSSTVSGRVEESAVVAAANSGLAMAELAAKLPKNGGFLQAFLGEQDLAVFGSQLVAFGTAIVQFSETVSGRVDENAVLAASNAGLTMAELSTKLPKSGGFLQAFLGEQDISVFGDQLVAFGTAVVRFSNTLVSGGINPEAVTAASLAGMAMAELADKIPKTGGLVEFFTGKNDMSKFGAQLAIFGESFSAYSNSVKDVKPDVVTSTSNAADSIVKLANSLPENKLFTNETTLDEFGKQLAKFGEKFAEYYNKISPINPSKLSAVIQELGSLLDVLNRMTLIDTTAVSNFGSSLKKLGESGIEEFISSIENGTPKVKSAASNTVSAFTDTISSETGRVTTAFSSMTDNALSGIQNDTQSFRLAGASLVDGFANGIRDTAPIAEAQSRLLATRVIETTNNTLGINSPSRVFYGIGGNIVQGLKNGIQNNTNGVTGVMASLGAKLVSVMKNKLGIHSPSRVMRDEVGHYIVEGVAEGITEDMSAEEAASKKAQNITSAFQEELDKLDLADKTAELESQLTGKSIDYAAQYERQMKRAELALGEYENMLKHVGETAKETQEAHNKYIQAQIDLQELTFNHSLEWIEKRKEASELNMIEELAAWKRVQARYLEGTEQRIQADEEVLRLQEELTSATEDYYNELKSIQEDAESKRSEIDQEYEDERTRIKEEANEERIRLDEEYAEKTKEINDQLLADIEAAEKAYQDAIKSRSNSIYNSYGLFDKVSAGDEVTGESLMENLQGQIDALDKWTSDINSLAGRGIEDGLLEELRDMGPSSAAQIAALNSMTDEELDKYVELWKRKHELAADQAEFELQGMRKETNETIEQLKEDAENKLEEYRETWEEQIEELNDNTGEQLSELKDNWRKNIEDLDAETAEKLEDVKNTWMESVLGISTETQFEFIRMTNNLVNTVGDKNKWNAVGINTISGMLQGIADKTPDLIEGVEDAMREALEAANRVLGINSPSKEFAKIGRYSDEGFALGLKKYASLITDSGAEVGEKALDTLRNAFAKAMDYITNDIDTQPTIRPVLDLTGISSETKKLSTMFSRTKALSIDASIRQRAETGSENQNGKNENRGGNVISFTQNNYSPKALSRVDIYRQTKNQFSAMERMVQK